MMTVIGTKNRLKNGHSRRTQELSLNYFPMSVHSELVEGWCQRTWTSSVLTESEAENREVISERLLNPLARRVQDNVWWGVFHFLLTKQGY